MTHRPHYIQSHEEMAAVHTYHFVNPRSALLYIWKVRADPWNRDHYPISTECNGIIQPGKGSKKASRLHNKDTDWTAFMEEV
jgi:hypothetical protein